MSDQIQTHQCCSPGLTMEKAVVEEIPNHGKPCFKATAKIGTIFGSEVEGELVGYGPTKGKALEALDSERHKLHESIHA